MTPHSLDTALLADMASIEAKSQRRALSSPKTIPGPWIEVGKRRMLNLGSNNYLGLAEHPDVRVAAADAAQTWGAGATGSRLTTGNLPPYADLEQMLASWKHAEACILYGSGYVANVSTIPALAGPKDLILSDMLNHASLIDGCRLSRATVRVYDHCDVDHARHLLQDRSQFRRVLLVTDGVFSMDGDIAPLPDLCDLAQEHDAWMTVDDAHGTGVLGATGGGTVEHFGLTHQIPVQIGTLSKALGAAGGYVTGSHVLIDFLRNRSRGFVFATAPVPAAAAGAIRALQVLQEEPERREVLQTNAEFLREELRRRGIPVTAGITPIIPVIVGSSQRARTIATALQARDIWAPAIRPPSVPEGTARLRLCVMATHTFEELAAAAEAIAESLQEAEQLADGSATAAVAEHEV